MTDVFTVAQYTSLPTLVIHTPDCIQFGTARHLESVRSPPQYSFHVGRPAIGAYCGAAGGASFSRIVRPRRAGPHRPVSRCVSAPAGQRCLRRHMSVMRRRLGRSTPPRWWLRPSSRLHLFKAHLIKWARRRRRAGTLERVPNGPAETEEAS